MPWLLTVDPSSNTIYIANEYSGSISIIAFNTISHEPFNYLWIIVAVVIAGIIAVLASVLIMRREKKKGGPKEWQ